MNKALVIIPTYNERETIAVVVDAVLKHEGFDVLVVDDASPDGTAVLVKEMMAEGKRVFLIERAGKLGLGTAYVEGFKWGLERGYGYFVEMDADNSHDPAVLPAFVEGISKGCGLIIGSRYLNGTISVVGWDFKRLMLSKFGNFYASRILGLRLTDVTSGFRCYSRDALTSIDLDGIHSTGYGFQIEMVFRISVAGYCIGEIPIIFYERTAGASKMSNKIIREATVLPWRLRLTLLFGIGWKVGVADPRYQLRTIIGFLVIIAGIAGSIGMGWWLGTRGDIIEIIHQVKTRLPDWAWTVMKIGLSALVAGVLAGIVGVLAVAVFAESRTLAPWKRGIGKD